MTIKSDLERIAYFYRCDDDVERAINEYKKDMCCARFNFHCLIDTLCKEGDISCKTHQNVDITLNKHNKFIIHFTDIGESQ